MSESNTRAEILEVMRKALHEQFSDTISPFGINLIASTALTALEASGRAVVPREPTPEMLEAGERVPVDHAWCSPINGLDMGERLSSAAPVWSAMLAAAIPPCKE